MVSLEKWLDNMTLAENLIKLRKNGCVYINMERWSPAESFARQVGVNLTDWVHTYFSEAVSDA